MTEGNRIPPHQAVNKYRDFRDTRYYLEYILTAFFSLSPKGVTEKCVALENTYLIALFVYRPVAIPDKHNMTSEFSVKQPIAYRWQTRYIHGILRVTHWDPADRYAKLTTCSVQQPASPADWQVILTACSM